MGTTNAALDESRVKFVLEHAPSPRHGDLIASVLPRTFRGHEDLEEGLDAAMGVEETDAAADGGVFACEQAHEKVGDGSEAEGLKGVQDREEAEWLGRLGCHWHDGGRALGEQWLALW